MTVDIVNECRYIVSVMKNINSFSCSFPEIENSNVYI